MQLDFIKSQLSYLQLVYCEISVVLEQFDDQESNLKYKSLEIELRRFRARALKQIKNHYEELIA